MSFCIGDIVCTPKSDYGAFWMKDPGPDRGQDISDSLQGAGGIGGLLATVRSGDPEPVEGFPLCDANGNITDYVTSDGTISAHYEYSPFGETIVSTGSAADENPFRFSTKYWDDETGLGYWGYRYFSAGMGRWLSRDPIEEDGGIALYVFVHNTPLYGIDANGLVGSDPLSCDGYRTQLQEKYRNLERARNARRGIWFARTRTRISLEVFAIYGNLEDWGYAAFSTARELLASHISGLAFNAENPVADFMGDAAVSALWNDWLNDYLRNRGVRAYSSNCSDAVHEFATLARISLGSQNLHGWVQRWKSQVQNDCPCLYVDERETLEYWEEHWSENTVEIQSAISEAAERVNTECGSTSR